MFFFFLNIYTELACIFFPLLRINVYKKQKCDQSITFLFIVKYIIELFRKVHFCLNLKACYTSEESNYAYISNRL